MFWFVTKSYKKTYINILKYKFIRMFKLNKYWPSIFIFLTTYIVREYKIEKGNFLTWDEAHFIKFANYYLQRTFYFDVHPPLGKLLTAFGGLISNLQEPYVIDEKYILDFDYVKMRRFHAFISSFIPVFIFLLLKEFKFSSTKRLICSFLFILENGFTCISRLVLLDSYLLTFTVAVTYFMVVLYKQNLKNKNKEDKIGKKSQNRSLHYSTLLKLGISIGCVISVKWIGCLTMALVGVYVIFDLFQKSLYVSLKRFLIYFTEYFVFLFILPLLIYIMFFKIHFLILSDSGPGDGNMSIYFQARLKNNPFKKNRKYISYGKQITIKGCEGYLHSHMHNYINSNKIQVTTYGSKDSNNNFYFQKISQTNKTYFAQDLDEIAIYHDETKGYIEIDNENAILSEGFNVYNRKGLPDSNSVWIIEIESDTIKKESYLKSITTSFYLKHRETGMYLSATNKVYPYWGFNQGELIGKKEKDKTCLWTIEENLWAHKENNPIYTEIERGFLMSFLELNKNMYLSNQSLVVDDNLEPESINSQPYEWPILYKGIRMSQWHDNDYKFYMFMNPFILYISSVSLIISFIIYVYRNITGKRNYTRIIESIKYNNMKLLNDNFKSTNKHDVLHTYNDKINSYYNVVKCMNKDSVSCTLKKIKENNESKHNIENCMPLVLDSNSKLIKKLENNIKYQKNNQIDGFFMFVIIFGWMIHYLIFFWVGRVLYFHHYFPSYVYSILSICYVLKYLKTKYIFIFICLASIVYFLYSPLTYGFLHLKDVKYLQLLPSWSFYQENSE